MLSFLFLNGDFISSCNKQNSNLGFKINLTHVLNCFHETLTFYHILWNYFFSFRKWGQEHALFHTRHSPLQSSLPQPKLFRPTFLSKSHGLGACRTGLWNMQKNKQLSTAATITPRIWADWVSLSFQQPLEFPVIIFMAQTHIFNHDQPRYGNWKWDQRARESRKRTIGIQGQAFIDIQVMPSWVWLIG